VSTAARAALLGLPRIARLDANETHLGPFPGALEAARRALGHAHRYPQHGAALLERLAERHRVHEDAIVVAHGADPLIGYLAMAFLESGDEAIMGVPSFVSYAQDVLRVGGRAIEVPVRGDGALDLPAMAERVSERTRLIFVCNPNNPTGGMLARRGIEELLEAVPATVLVVLDEAYAEYVEAPEYAGGPALAATRTNVVVLRTFSKLFGLAGLRIGYMVGPPPVVLAVRRLRHWYDVSDAAHLAALACLADPAEVARRSAATRRARGRLTAILVAHGLPTLPSQTSFVASRVPGAVALAERLASRGVFVRAIPDPSGDLLRIVAGDAADLAQLDAALSAED
jgi:histidinol-phosphate aminotransferase